jgi:hypothetical protein
MPSNDKQTSVNMIRVPSASNSPRFRLFHAETQNKLLQARLSIRTYLHKHEVAHLKAENWQLRQRLGIAGDASVTPNLTPEAKSAKAATKAAAKRGAKRASR